MKSHVVIFGIIILTVFNACSQDSADPESDLPQVFGYPIVDTGVNSYYSDVAVISEPSIGEAFFGQDASDDGNQPYYTDNGDGTITDNVTGLMWEKSMGNKITFDAAFVKAEASTLGNYTDWRVPTLKELYSLIQFTGQVKGATAISLFIDTDYFDQPLGNTSIGEREIDAQTWSSTEYVGETMNGDATVFGVNFVDGRIKGYPKFKKSTGSSNTMYFRMVRGNTEYGENNFVDNKDGTISDLATGLMWQAADDGISRNWEEALSEAEALELGGHSDWRLPNALVILVNSDNGSIISEVKLAIAREYNLPGIEANIKKVVQLPTESLEKYTGTYQIEDQGQLEIFELKRHLGLYADFIGDTIQLLAESDTLFFEKSDGTPFRFSIEDDFVVGFEVQRFTAERVGP